jgi:hypothetical protein
MNDVNIDNIQDVDLKGYAKKLKVSYQDISDKTTYSKGTISGWLKPGASSELRLYLYKVIEQIAKERAGIECEPLTPPGDLVANAQHRGWMNGERLYNTNNLELKKFLMENHITVLDVAKKTYFAPNTVYRWLRSPISEYHLEIVSRAIKLILNERQKDAEQSS